MWSESSSISTVNLAKRYQIFPMGYFVAHPVCKLVCCCRSLGPSSAADLVLTTDGCAGASNAVKYLEHVQVVVTLGAAQRGKVELSLTSPSGTRQVLLARRNVDVSPQGLNNWALMTVHCWGEDPRGTWTLTVSTTSTSGTFCLVV